MLVAVAKNNPVIKLLSAVNVIITLSSVYFNITNFKIITINIGKGPTLNCREVSKQDLCVLKIAPFPHILPKYSPLGEKRM